MKVILRVFRGAVLLKALVVMPAWASTPNSNYITGNIVDVTSVRGALLVRMDDNRVPTDCQGSGSAWMRIDQAHTVMASLVLTYWTQRKTLFTLYIDNWTSGYCSVNQADPAD